MIDAAKTCCAPRTGRNDLTPTNVDASSCEVPRDFVDIPGGIGFVGTNSQHLPLDEEGPLQSAKIKPFRMAACAVSNAEFARFIQETDYQTDAERYGWSFVFHDQVPENFGATQAVVEANWWRRVDGAIWSEPFGPGTGEACFPNHPVVHVSWNDARVYAKWAGGRLPTEAEWEHAARGGLGDVIYPWGDVHPDDTDHLPCNIWQGHFPQNDTGADGYHGTAPVNAFQPNGYGLYNMSGNTWEWTSEPFRLKSLKKTARVQQNSRKRFKLIKGGSYLCHQSYCYRYRIAARTGNSPDSTTTHQGFRLVFPPK